MDYKFGTDNENILLPKLQTFFNDPTIKKTTYKSCPFDFEGDTGLYELKTRKCNLNRYNTTIFPENKFKFKPERNKVLVFSFLDGDYYLPYDKELFDTFEKENRQFRFDRGNLDHPQPYIHIPVTKLLAIAV
jgi:hypothetical protein